MYSVLCTFDSSQYIYIYTITFQQLLKHGIQFQMFTLTFQQQLNKQTKTHYISTAAKTWYTISNVYTHISTTFKQTNKNTLHFNSC